MDLQDLRHLTQQDLTWLNEIKSDHHCSTILEIVSYFGSIACQIDNESHLSTSTAVRQTLCFLCIHTESGKVFCIHTGHEEAGVCPNKILADL